MRSTRTDRAAATIAARRWCAARLLARGACSSARRTRAAGCPFPDASRLRRSASHRCARTAEMPHEMLVAALELGPLRRGHVLQSKVRQVCLMQHLLVGPRPLADVFWTANHAHNDWTRLLKVRLSADWCQLKAQFCGDFGAI